jgi:hypothetical protein
VNLLTLSKLHFIIFNFSIFIFNKKTFIFVVDIHIYYFIIWRLYTLYVRFIYFCFLPKRPIFIIFVNDDKCISFLLKNLCNIQCEFFFFLMFFILQYYFIFFHFIKIRTIKFSYRFIS